MKNKSKPITKKKEIRKHPDRRIDQDFPGYPNGTASDETINPDTPQQQKIADLDNTDGEKRIYKRNEIDEQDSDGSANAFDEK